MKQEDVAAAEAGLSELVRQYVGDRSGRIRTIEASVAENGSFAAADVSDAFANARQATVSEARFLEATVRSDDKAPINFLERGIRASRAVCRIIDANRVALGTGFLIGPGLLMTNNHVLPTAADSQEAFAEFDYEEDADERPLRTIRFALDPTTTFVTSPETRLDFSIIAVARTSITGEDLSARGWLPLDRRPNKILEGQPVVIIQHPDGQLKQICLFDSVLKFRDDEAPYLIYTTDTAYGSSGSACFNRFWQVIALHHANVEMVDPANGQPIVYNRGIRISAIFSELEAQAATGAGHAAVALRVLEDPATVRNGRPFATMASLATPSQSTEVAPGGSPAPAIGGAGQPSFERTPTIVRVRQPVTHLDDRTGYDPAFLIPEGERGGDLGDHALYLPLPQVPDWLREDTVRLIRDREAFELKYQHSSIVLSRSRKLALFTATNVDGALLRNLDREDRDPDAPMDGVRHEAASDVWYFDPRIDERDQLGPRIYDATDFDFGHLVRRLDPVWGSDERILRIANDDTFYMTNCAPHEARFHRTRRDKMTWSKLEDKVLGAARTTRKRFIVLTGPILDARDPYVGGVKIPTAFWKIAAYEKDARLRAHGYMLWQKNEVETMPRPRFEGLELLDQAEEPVRVREIARLTGLDLGPLVEADILP